MGGWKILCCGATVSTAMSHRVDSTQKTISKSKSDSNQNWSEPFFALPQREPIQPITAEKITAEIYPQKITALERAVILQL